MDMRFKVDEQDYISDGTTRIQLFYKRHNRCAYNIGGGCDDRDIYRCTPPGCNIRRGYTCLFRRFGPGLLSGHRPHCDGRPFAVASSLGVEWMSSRHRVREDSAIAVIWSIGMAVGVLFVFLTPGFVPELNAFLFGSILNISVADLWLFAGYTTLLVLFFWWKFREIVICAFDRDFARVAGLPVKFVTITMTVFVALCIVLTIRLVGIMLLMSMISLPQMTAEIFCKRFRTVMLMSVFISVAGCLGGLVLSAYIDVPCSALIVIVLAGMFITGRVYSVVARKLALRQGGVRS